MWPRWREAEAPWRCPTRAAGPSPPPSGGHSGFVRRLASRDWRLGRAPSSATAAAATQPPLRRSRHGRMRLRRLHFPGLGLAVRRRAVRRPTWWRSPDPPWAIEKLKWDTGTRAASEVPGARELVLAVVVVSADAFATCSSWRFQVLRMLLGKEASRGRGTSLATPALAQPLQPAASCDAAQATPGSAAATPPLARRRREERRRQRLRGTSGGSRVQRGASTGDWTIASALP